MIENPALARPTRGKAAQQGHLTQGAQEGKLITACQLKLSQSLGHSLSRTPREPWSYRGTEGRAGNHAVCRRKAAQLGNYISGESRLARQ